MVYFIFRCRQGHFIRELNLPGIFMDHYIRQVSSELNAWQKQMTRKPSFLNNLSKKVQTKVNSWIPEKVHKAITVAINQMIRGVLFGARHTTAKPFLNASLQIREQLVLDKVNVYRKTAAIEGGITGLVVYCWGLLISLFSQLSR